VPGAPPKVCLVVHGPARYFRRVERNARALAANGWEVVLVGIRDDEAPAFEQREGYTVKRVSLATRALPDWSRPLRFVEGVAKTFWAAWREDADVYNPRDIPPMLACQLAAWLRGAVVVTDSDELNLYRNWPWTKAWWWKPLAKPYEGFFLRRAAACMTSDEGRADILVREYGISRPVVVLNVPERYEKLEPDLEFRERALGGRRYLLIYQGVLVPNRGLPQLVEAMRRLDDCALVLVGRGHLRDALRRQVADLGLGDRVSVLDIVSFDQMMRMTAASDAGLIPIVGSCLSYVYAAPSKLFEDMMAGVPVVASDLPDMAEVVRREGVGSLIADPEDPAAIADAVRRLLDDEEPPRVKGERGRAAALARYNWERERAKLLDVYARLPRRARR
jgi:glycosyltransferase involved in cell wall biosynthesis